MEWFHVFMAVAADANQHFWEMKFALEHCLWVQGEKGFLQSRTRPTLAHYYMNYWVLAITNSQSKGKTHVVLPEDMTSVEKKWRGEMSAAGMQAAFSMLGKTSCWGQEEQERPGEGGKVSAQEAQRWHKRQKRDSPGFSWCADRHIAVDMGTGSYSRAEVEP